MDDERVSSRPSLHFENVARKYRELGHGMTAVLYTALSIESFMNDLAWAFELYGNDSYNYNSLRIALADLETSNASVLLKYQTTLLFLTKDVVNKGGSDFQNLKLLFDIRNGIVHSRSDHALVDIDENDNIQYHRQDKSKKLTNQLIAKGLVPRFFLNQPYDWREFLELAEVMDWAIDVMESTKSSVVNLIDDDEVVDHLTVSTDNIKSTSKQNK